MIKTSIAAALALALAAGTAMAEFKDFTVNGELVTKAQQEAVATEVLANSGNPHQAMMDSSIEEQVKDMIIETKVMGRYARQQGLDKDPAVQEQIARATDMILMQQAVNKFLKDNPVKEETIKAEYDKEAQRWGDTEVRVRHILVKTEEQAKNLIKRLGNKGANFDKLAEEFSEDTGNKNQGGLLGWVVPRSYPAAFGVAFSALKPGEVAQTPIRTQYGFHVVKLDAKRPAQLFPAYESQAPQLKNALTNQRMQQHFLDLAKKAKVE